ncbi:hypothetical protein BLFGPEAP_02423 [Candidatus Methanoperedenaceae archaeon GB50]|nr:hypothetical protein BLFGPEAP_02423 [Candidatus Methanoperedenaceae archaeon GB50]
MVKEGHVVLFRFPQTDLKEGKLRPALVIKNYQGNMISSKSYQFNKELDEIITPEDKDFQESGLKTESVIRVSRLGVGEKDILIGRIGKISSERLKRIKDKLGKWIME